VVKEQRPLLLEQISWADGLGRHRLASTSTSCRWPTRAGSRWAWRSPSSTSPYPRLHEELEHSNRDLETAYEELQSTNEELETTNEELQSTIEELETTNEELQSTNEELETMTPSCSRPTRSSRRSTTSCGCGRGSSTRQRFPGVAVISQGGGLVVIDRELRISVWNDRSASCGGSGSRRRRASTSSHRHRPPGRELRPLIRAVLAGDSERETVDLEAHEPPGPGVPLPHRGDPSDQPGPADPGAILLMEETTG